MTPRRPFLPEPQLQRPTAAKTALVVLVQPDATMILALRARLSSALREVLRSNVEAYVVEEDRAAKRQRATHGAVSSPWPRSAADVVSE